MLTSTETVCHLGSMCSMGTKFKRTKIYYVNVDYTNICSLKNIQIYGNYIHCLVSYSVFHTSIRNRASVVLAGYGAVLFLV